MGTAMVSKSQTLTQMSTVAESVQGSCFHQEAPQELLISRQRLKLFSVEERGLEWAHLRSIKFPVAWKEEDGYLLVSTVQGRTSIQWNHQAAEKTCPEYIINL